MGAGRLGHVREQVAIKVVFTCSLGSLSVVVVGAALAATNRAMMVLQHSLESLVRQFAHTVREISGAMTHFFMDFSCKLLSFQ